MSEQPTTDEPRVTVNDLRTLLLPAGKDWGVLIAGTPEGTQFVTWGRSPENKCYASDLSEHLGKELCNDTPFVVYESFKLDAAKNKARVEELEKDREWLLRCEAAIKNMAAQFIHAKTTPEEMVDQILKGDEHGTR